MLYIAIHLIALKQFCEKFKQQLRIGFFLGKFLSSEIIGHLCLFCEARFLCIRQNYSKFYDKNEFHCG